MCLFPVSHPQTALLIHSGWGRSRGSQLLPIHANYMIQHVYTCVHTHTHTHTHTPTHPSFLRLLEPAKNVGRPKTIFADLFFSCVLTEGSPLSPHLQSSLGHCSVFNHVLEDRMIRGSGICLVDNSILLLGRICEQ